MALTNGQTRETLANDMWQACKILAGAYYALRYAGQDGEQDEEGYQEASARSWAAGGVGHRIQGMYPSGRALGAQA